MTGRASVAKLGEDAPDRTRCVVVIDARPKFSNRPERHPARRAPPTLALDHRIEGSSGRNKRPRIASFAGPMSRRHVAKPLCHYLFDHLELGFVRGLFFPATRRSSEPPSAARAVILLPAGIRPPFNNPPADPALPAPTPRLVPRPAALRPFPCFPCDPQSTRAPSSIVRRPRPNLSRPAPGIGFVRASLIPSSSSFRALRAFCGQALPVKRRPRGHHLPCLDLEVDVRVVHRLHRVLAPEADRPLQVGERPEGRPSDLVALREALCRVGATSPV